MTEDYLTEWEARNAEWALDDEEVLDQCPAHPGPILRDEVLQPRNITVSALARAIGASRPDLSNALNGKLPITPALALRIEAATGYPADLLARMQLAHDLGEARRAGAERLAALNRIAA